MVTEVRFKEEEKKLVKFTKLKFIIKQPLEVTRVSIPWSTSLFFPPWPFLYYSEILTGSLEVQKSM